MAKTTHNEHDENNNRQGDRLWLVSLTDSGIADYEKRYFPAALSPTAPPMVNAIADYLRGQKQSSDYAFALRRERDGAAWVGAAGLQYINWKARHVTLWIVMFDGEAASVDMLTEAAEILLRYGFYELNLNRIGVGAVAYRPDWLAGLRGAGFEDEARLREHVYYEGQYHDMLYLAAFRESLTLG